MTQHRRIALIDVCITICTQWVIVLNPNLLINRYQTSRLVDFIFFIMVFLSSASLPVIARCPANVWDRPVALCSLPIELIRPIIQNFSLPVEIRVNLTCEAWLKSTDCFRRLQQRCITDEDALLEIDLFRQRYLYFSLPCFEDEYKHRQRLVDCLHPHITPTKKCLQAFDRTYRAYAYHDQFHRVCRVVASVMRCLYDIKANIRKECSDEGAQIYNQNFIEPTVTLIQPIFSKNCDTTSDAEYMEYLSGASRHGFTMIILVWITLAAIIS